MYIRKLYDPEDKLRLQIPGHGTGSAAGTAAQQEVWGKTTKVQNTRQTTKTGLPTLNTTTRKGGSSETEVRSGTFSAVPLKNPYSVAGKHGETVEKVVSVTSQTLQQQISDTKTRLDSLNERRKTLSVPLQSEKPDLATILFGRGSAAPSREARDQAETLDNQILETEKELSQYQDQLLHLDIVTLYGRKGIEGWDAYIQYTQELERAKAERLENESWQDKLGRYMSGNTRDTTLPFHIDEQEMAEGYRAQERGKREPDDRWTNEQKADFGFLWGSSPQMAGDYAMLLNKRLDAEDEETQTENIREWSTRNPFNARLATAGSIVASPVGGMADYLNDMMAYGTLGYIPETDGTVDPWEFSQTVTSGISEELNGWGTLPEGFPVLGGKGFGDVYSLGTTVAQSSLAALSGGPGQAIVTFIGPAAAAAKDEALRRGADDDKALIYGGIVGLIEAGAEAIGSENIVRLFSSGGLKALFSSAGMGESLEEGAASLATFIADVLLFREDSTFANRVEAYREGGATKLEAVAGAAWDTVEDILYDSLAGGVSGELHAGMARAWDAVSNALGETDTAYRPGNKNSQTGAGHTPAQSTPNIGAALTDAGTRGLEVLARSETAETGKTLANTGILGAESMTPYQTQTSAPAQTDASGLTTDTWTNDLDGLWTESVDMQTDVDAETAPARYEDALRQYLEGDTSLSSGDIPSIADLNVDSATDIEVIPKTKEQLISELAPKISKPGITPGRATIAAEQMYVEAEKWYGSNADIVLEMFRPGQEPRKFLDGFQNAYLAGKMGNSAALKNSGVARYLTEEQRTLAFELGESVETFAKNNLQQNLPVHQKGILGASGNMGEKAKPYSQRGIQIEHRLRGYLNKLQGNGDYITVPTGEIRNRDLAVLTTETGVEFTLVNVAGKTFLIRGGENFTTIPQEILELVIDRRGSIECHSHPYIGDLVPSEADMQMMELLTWLEESTIIDPTEKISRYNSFGLIDIGTEVCERNASYYEDMDWGEE